MNPVEAVAEPEMIEGEEEGEETQIAAVADEHDDLAPEFGDEAKLFCSDAYKVTETKGCLGAINCDAPSDLIVGQTVTLAAMEAEVKSVKFDADGTKHVVLYAEEFTVKE